MSRRWRLTRRVVVSVVLVAALIGGALHFRPKRTPPPDQEPAILKGEAPLAPGFLRIRLPPPRSLTLPNGLRLCILEDHRLPYVRCTLALPGGSLGEVKPAVAEMTASLLTEGTQSLPEAALAAADERLGMTLWARTEPDTLVVHVGGLSMDTDALIGTLRDVALHPAFAPDRLERLRRVRCAGLAQERDNSRFVINQVSGRVFYGRTPYAFPAPSARAIQAVSRRDVLDFYRQVCRPNGAVLAVYGDADPRRTLRRVQDAFAAWKPDPSPLAPPPPRFPPPAAPRLSLVDWRHADDTVLSFQCLTVAYTDRDYAPLVVADRILGGVPSSRLFRTLRDSERLTYGGYSSLAAERWPGVWQYDVTVRREETGAALDTVFRQIRRLQDEPVSAQELVRAKRGLIGGFALTLESPDWLVGAALSESQDNLPAHYWDRYPARIQAVTAADVQRVARRYWGNRIQVIAVGARDRIATTLHRYGPVEYLDAEGRAPRRVAAGAGPARGS